jgi:hypothetical protein
VTHSVSLFGGFGQAFYDLDPDKLVEVGDRWVPAEIVVKLPGNANEPDIGLRIEVRQGVPVYTEVVLHARSDGPDVRSRDVADIALDDWLDAIVAACSYSRLGAADSWVKGDRRDALANVRKVRSGRPRISRERLVRVAEIYREHFDARPTDAVRRAFGVSDRTAARYVENARKAGLLPPTTPGKKKA